ncbi:DUF4489 domain-containing protein [Wukongibacter baidiensis]|uniref:DUF4489 domain-containing protein n=1 Tax=Wukongibacter baidiensis TaxID=1723361 RepID=UPI003D7FD32C
MSTSVKDCNCKRIIYDDCDKEICDEKCKMKKNRKAKPTTLSCGTGNSVTFDAVGSDNEVVIPSPSSAIVGQVSIDACDKGISTIEIEFSSIVNLTASFDDARGALIFRLFRTCGNDETELVNTWTYEVLEIEDVNVITLSNSYSFTFCECLKNAGCCSYFVEASVGGLINIETLSVNNVQISAIVQ